MVLLVGQSQYNMVEWSNMSTCGLLLEWSNMSTCGLLLEWSNMSTCGLLSV